MASQSILTSRATMALTVALGCLTMLAGALCGATAFAGDAPGAAGNVDVSPGEQDAAAGRPNERHAPQRVPEVPPGPAESELLPRLQRGIDLGVGYILRNCDESGQFAYVRYADPERKVRPQYNLLRHCGAVYALGMAAKAQPQRVEAIAPATRRACEFLRKNGFLAPVPGAKDTIAIWEIPGSLTSRPPAGAPVVAKLGGAGLGLLALLADFHLQTAATPGGLPPAQREQKLQEMRSLARFILLLQESNGRFVSRYILGKGHDDSFESLYYPGEAMLGLLELYRIDCDRQWLEASAAGMKYLCQSRARTGEYPADHWALLATAKLRGVLPELPNAPLTQEQLLEHARTICRVMIAQQRLNPSDAAFGAFAVNGTTCPTSIRVEGMLGAYAALPADDPLREPVRRSCDLALQFLCAAQIPQGAVAGGMPRAVVRLPEAPAKKGGADSDEWPETRQSPQPGAQGAAGKAGEKAAARQAEEDDDAQGRNAARENARMGEVRIDYVQHALSAMLMRAAPDGAAQAAGASGVAGVAEQKPQPAGENKP